MRVLCCYTFIEPATVESLRQYASGAEFIGVVGDLYGTWREIEKRWTGDEDLVIIDHDIEIHPDVLPQFRECPEEWCFFGFQAMSPGYILEEGFGCCRFRAELQRQVSVNEILAVPASCWECKGIPGCHRHNDGRMTVAITAHGFRMHKHGPPYVTHHKKIFGNSRFNDNDTG
jgi:hypothetical protein